jgi:hypothetical protein
MEIVDVTVFYLETQRPDIVINHDQGVAVLRPTGNRKDAHDPFLGRRAARPHHSTHLGGTGPVTGRIHDSRQTAATIHGRH